MNNLAPVADLLSFWIGEPAETAPQILAKYQRWYQGGPELDQAIQGRYGSLVESAIARARPGHSARSAFASTTR